MFPLHPAMANFLVVYVSVWAVLFVVFLFSRFLERYRNRLGESIERESRRDYGLR